MTTLPTIFYQHPVATVKSSPTLIGDYVDVPYLYLQELRLALSPDIDTATLLYDYGKILREDESAFTDNPALELDNQYLRIEISATVSGEDPIVWYGIVEVDELTPAGSSNLVATGQQRIIAYGMARLLERRQIFSSLIQRGSTYIPNVVGNTLFSPGHGLGEGDRIFVISTGDEPAPLTPNTQYFVRTVLSPDEFLISESLGGPIITLTTRGTGEHRWQCVTKTLGIARGLSFNVDDSAGQTERANRARRPNDPGGVYLFSADRRAGQSWSGLQAVEYLLSVDAPKIADEISQVDWVLEDDDTKDALRWIQPNAPRDGRNIKDVIDAIIDRRRGLWWYAWFDGNFNEVKIRAGTFAETDFTLPSGAVLPANTRQQALNFEQSFDVEDVSINNTMSQEYDTIVAQGDFRTTTMTAYFTRDVDDPIMQNDWTPEAEETFRAGATKEAGYPGLTTEEQQKRNQHIRTSDDADQVFAQYRVYDNWVGRVQADRISDTYPAGAQYFVNPPLVDAGGNPDQLGDPNPLYNPATNANPRFVIWNPGIRFQPRLPFKVGPAYDYSGVKIADKTFVNTAAVTGKEPFQPPFAFFRVADIDGQAQYAMANRLGTNNAETPRPFNVGLQNLNTGPQVRVYARPQNQLIALTEWQKDEAFTVDVGTDIFTSAAHGLFNNDTIVFRSTGTLPAPLTAGTIYYVIDSTLDTFRVSLTQGGAAVDITAVNDPSTWGYNLGITNTNTDPTTQNGLAWDTMYATMTFRLDERVQIVNVINEVGAEDFERRLVLQLPKYRLDYVTPYTVFDVNGSQQVSTSGGFVRDDRDDLADIAASAAQWYGTIRQAFAMTFKQVRDLAPLGNLITTIGADYNIENVNSVVSGLSFQMPQTESEVGTTTIETEFVDLDFA